MKAPEQAEVQVGAEAGQLLKVTQAAAMAQAWAEVEVALTPSKITTKRTHEACNLAIRWRITCRRAIPFWERT